MDIQDPIETVLHGWLSARSLARGLPPPAADHGGWRVDTNLPSERRRYVFARPTADVESLARSIDLPGIMIKLCSPIEVLRTLLPDRFLVAPQSWMLITGGSTEARPRLSPKYQLSSRTLGEVTTVAVVDSTGALAASGTAAEHDGIFVYDRIVTDTAHRRRGLGTAVMAALAQARRESGSHQILVATAGGRALYRSLGWTDYSPYASAAIPAHPEL